MSTGLGLQRLYLVGSYLFELAKGALLVVAVGIAVHSFIATVFVIDGDSMEPTLSSGQGIVVSKLGYLLGSPRRGDIVVLRFPGDPFKKRYIKRIVGLPGERIELKDGAVFVGNRRLEEPYLEPSVITESFKLTTFNLGPDEYLALGDNRAISNDSRIWGALPKDLIVGRASFVAWPFGGLWGVVGRPQYAQ